MEATQVNMEHVYVTSSSSAHALWQPPQAWDRPTMTPRLIIGGPAD